MSSGVSFDLAAPQRDEEGMSEKVVPMIHVPDVRAAVEWYTAIGFTVTRTHDDGDGLSFALLSFGSSELMFNEGGTPSTQDRREFDLYVFVNNVDGLFGRLKDRVEVVEGLHDTAYGMQEFSIRDLNRFWVTFGAPSAFEVLMTGIRKGNKETVQIALDRGGLTPSRLSAALAAAASGDNQNAAIVEILKKAGAIPPFEVDDQTLQSYAGKYKNEQGLEINVILKDRRLLVSWFTGQQPLGLMPVDQTTFRPIAFDDLTVTFHVEAGKTTGYTLKHESIVMEHKRVEETQEP